MATSEKGEDPGATQGQLLCAVGLILPTAGYRTPPYSGPWRIRGEKSSLLVTRNCSSYDPGLSLCVSSLA